MTISPLSSATSGAVSQVSSSASGTNGLGSDAFLKLLVAQLKYQDPMNPAQGTEFMAQTAQFTMVEKLDELNQHNSDALLSQLAMQATGMVGHTIAYQDDNGVSQSGAVTAAKLLATGPVLMVGGKEISLSRVTEVQA